VLVCFLHKVFAPGFADITSVDGQFVAWLLK
jgi:hypothetical protein